MMSKNFSPSRLLIKAMEIYLKDEDITIEQLLENEKNSDLRLHTISFALQNLLSYFGYKVNNTISENKIIVKCNDVKCYSIEEDFSKFTSVPSLCFKLVILWGKISVQLDNMGYGNKDVNKSTQISLAI